MVKATVARRFSSFIKEHQKVCLAFSIVLAFFIILPFAVHLDFSDEINGLYLLKCDRGRALDIKTDLLLGEENRLLAKLEFQPIIRFFGGGERPARKAHLEYRWNKRNGSGYIFNHNSDGTQLLTCFSRFLDSQGAIPKGLFIGGGLPYSRHDDIELTMSATGMAHFNGKEWHHLWCNANETIASGPDEKHDPSTWQFIGSKIVSSNDQKLILRSSHLIPFKGTTLRMDRYAVFQADQNYLILMFNITNIGSMPTEYFYVYGDEPWVGEFGTASGNVGWSKEKLYYFEGAVNPQTNSYAGMYDKGNPYILGEKKSFTGMANFIQWMGDNKPDLVYFSNKEGQFAEEKEMIPLHSKDNRVIFLNGDLVSLGRMKIKI